MFKNVVHGRHNIEYWHKTFHTDQFLKNPGNIHGSISFPGIQGKANATDFLFTNTYKHKQ